MSVLLIRQLTWCMREVLFAVYLEIVSPSLWELLLPHTKRVVLMGDDKRGSLWPWL